MLFDCIISEGDSSRRAMYRLWGRCS